MIFNRLFLQMACLTLHSRLLAAANMSVVCETLTNLGKNFVWRFNEVSYSILLVEHLIRWFSSSNIDELQPTATFIDISDPIIEIQFRQVKIT